VKKPVKPPTPEKQLPLVAIIIDDLGYDKKIAKKFSNLNAMLTFSILPYSPHQKSIARLSRDKGFGIMLHLPMEPVEYPDVNPGPGTLLTSMTPDQLTRQLEKDLDAVPFIRGVNNHMGSKMSNVSDFLDSEKKRPIFRRQPHNRGDTLQTFGPPVSDPFCPAGCFFRSSGRGRIYPQTAKRVGSNCSAQRICRRNRSSAFTNISSSSRDAT